jgi:hypothetical protein
VTETVGRESTDKAGILCIVLPSTLLPPDTSFLFNLMNYIPPLPWKAINKGTL